MLAAAAALGFTACSDDDELPNVTIDTTYTGAVQFEGALYVVQTDTFAITSVAATPVREGKRAAITTVAYGLDGWVAGVTDIPPFAATFNPGSMAVGKHILTMTMGIAETGCTPATGYYATDLFVVATPEELPTPAPETPQGRFSSTPSIQN